MHHEVILGAAWCGWHSRRSWQGWKAVESHVEWMEGNRLPKARYSTGFGEEEMLLDLKKDGAEEDESMLI
jgi:hypothetical protein